MTNEAVYRIHLPQFDGPFDLLLFFIERDEIDIYDIPIAKITNDFLAYLHQLERQNLDVASEFILMAAKLMKIKAATLLPRQPVNEKGEVVDPRTELVDRLLEYKRYKHASEQLEIKEAEMLKLYKRGYSQGEAAFLKDEYANPNDELQHLSLFQLFKTFKRINERFTLEQKKPKHVIQSYPYTIEQVREEVKNVILVQKKLEFHKFAETCPNLLYLVFSFLAILELLQMNSIRIIIGDGYNQFWLVESSANAA